MNVVACFGSWNSSRILRCHGATIENCVRG